MVYGIMTWNGEFVFGDIWAAFRRQAGDNRMHKHAALQLTFSFDGKVLITDKYEKKFSGHALIVKAGVQHCLLPSGKVFLLFIEPQSSLAQFINTNSGEGSISSLTYL